MFRKSKTRRLREAQVEARAAVVLTRIMFAELARWTFEGARKRRALELGALAVGLTTAGVIARHAVHREHAPTPAA
jgi:hypothetical protein